MSYEVFSLKEGSLDYGVFNDENPMEKDKIKKFVSDFRSKLFKDAENGVVYGGVELAYSIDNCGGKSHRKSHLWLITGGEVDHAYADYAILIEGINLDNPNTVNDHPYDVTLVAFPSNNAAILKAFTILENPNKDISLRDQLVDQIMENQKARNILNSCPVDAEPLNWLSRLDDESLLCVFGSGQKIYSWGLEMEPSRITVEEYLRNNMADVLTSRGVEDEVVWEEDAKTGQISVSIQPDGGRLKPYVEVYEPDEREEALAFYIRKMIESVEGNDNASSLYLNDEALREFKSDIAEDDEEEEEELPKPSHQGNLSM